MTDVMKTRTWRAKSDNLMLKENQIFYGVALEPIAPILLFPIIFHYLD